MYNDTQIINSKGDQFMDNYSSSAGLVISPIILIICLALLIFFIACEWKIFKKAGKPGWASLIPFYSTYVLFEIVYGKGIKFLLLLIPVFNVILSIALQIRTAEVYGKGIGFGILNIFLPCIALPILAFGDAISCFPLLSLRLRNLRRAGSGWWRRY